jgi:penicillin-binding protein 1A
MTDLLQAAVMTGTGRAAQIGRPVAGKTGTTSSNKDGWFIGFSSGLTAGVWMGRDDARPVGGLQGATSPARAFHDFMVVAVAKRPVEHFQTEVPMPNWDLTAEEEAWGADNQVGFEPLVDENGNPLPIDQQPYAGEEQPVAAPQRQGTTVDQQWLDQVLPPGQGQRQPQQQPRPQPEVVRPQPSQQPGPRSVPAPQTSEPGGGASQE